MRVTRLIAYWAPAVLWMLFIAWMSTSTFSSENTARIIEPVLRYVQPSITETEIDWYHAVIRKLAHVVEYFILGLLLFRAFRADSDEKRTGRWAAYSFLVVVLYASSDEFHQSFLSERTASLVDIAIDAFGGFLALCGCVLLHAYHRK